jgi:hypothetical protein
VTTWRAEIVRLATRFSSRGGVHISAQESRKHLNAMEVFKRTQTWDLPPSTSRLCGEVK